MAKFAAILTFKTLDRDGVRPAHREYLKSLLDNGKLLESGPFADDWGALIIYEAKSQAEVENLIANDPYSLHGGMVAKVEIREWNRVIPAP